MTSWKLQTNSTHLLERLSHSLVSQLETEGHLRASHPHHLQGCLCYTLGSSPVLGRVKARQGGASKGVVIVEEEIPQVLAEGEWYYGARPLERISFLAI